MRVRGMFCGDVRPVQFCFSEAVCRKAHVLGSVARFAAGKTDGFNLMCVWSEMSFELKCVADGPTPPCRNCMAGVTTGRLISNIIHSGSSMRFEAAGIELFAPSLFEFANAPPHGR